MLNVKAVPCEKSKATVLTSKKHFDININFLDKLEKTNPHFFDMAFEILASAGGLQSGIAFYFGAFRKCNSKSWYRFLKFCKKDGRIKVYRKNNKMVYEVPTYFEE